MVYVLALSGAVFAGLVSVLGKRGLVGVSANLATAIRSVVALFFSFILVLVSGSLPELLKMSAWSYLFLILSGLATGASWMLYFHALKLGRVSQVVAVDRTSVLFTGLFAIAFLGETDNLLLRVAGLTMVLIGTWVLISKTPGHPGGYHWFLPAIGSMAFAVATTILAKLGLTEVNSNLATMIRTFVVVLVAGLIVYSRSEQRQFSSLSRSNLLFLVFSGLASGLSWVCFFGALKMGQVSQVVAIDKLSLLFAAGFAFLFLGERLGAREIAGLTIALAGTFLLIS